ncbi:30S ribosomal protein S11 [Elysia marginata]|uniref:30S ribosomal protein S11 n=1 Tax=Elysia marginata TaxID=1093978 RepID=A0AAV4H7X8_9GAST|nr:30S ribosomal protein S11 [Elysia marginata]
MLKTFSLAQNVCVRCHRLFVTPLRNLTVTSVSLAGSKGYDRFKASVKQAGVDTSEDGLGDNQPLQYDKTYGTSSFPNVDTHSQVFDGMKYTDVPIVHVKATTNNTILTVASGSSVLALQSAGTVGFRNARKGTNVAAQAAAIALASDALRKDVKTVRVCLKGIGPGRLQVFCYSKNHHSSELDLNKGYEATKSVVRPSIENFKASDDFVSTKS